MALADGRPTLFLAARGCGAMWRLIEETTAWAAAREQGGARLLDHQGVAFPLADPAADAAAGRLLGLEVARLADAGADPNVIHAKASMAKLFVSEAANRCADRCLQAVGGRGYTRINVAERFWRVDRIWEGTSEMQRLIITRARAPRRRAGAPLTHIGDRSVYPAFSFDRATPRLPANPAQQPPNRGLSPLTGLDLSRLLRPASVAVVGASERPGRMAARRCATSRGWATKGACAVTRGTSVCTACPPTRRSASCGRRRTPSWSRCPPAPDVVREAGAAALQEELVAAAGGMPVCGPNGNGIVSLWDRVARYGARWSRRSSRDRWR